MVRNFVDEGHFIVQLVRGKCYMYMYVLYLDHTLSQSCQKVLLAGKTRTAVTKGALTFIMSTMITMFS